MPVFGKSFWRFPNRQYTHHTVLRCQPQCNVGNKPTFINKTRFSISLPKSHLRKAKLGPNIRKAYQNILSYIIPKLKLENYSSSRDLDKVASSLQTSLTLALNITAPPRRPPSRKVKPHWWDENIEQVRRTSRRLFNNARTTKLDSP